MHLIIFAAVFKFWEGSPEHEPTLRRKLKCKWWGREEKKDTYALYLFSRASHILGSTFTCPCQGGGVEDGHESEEKLEVSGRQRRVFVFVSAA